ncbi:MAG TPA: prenyltransferase/squalene oxidase repeat-containing protein [Planctomycetaceae bacterium]|nr:prenyltransferase/squalene oxidase repeat-containing protein [Planctomycetaceae bacterium]
MAIHRLLPTSLLSCLCLAAAASFSAVAQEPGRRLVEASGRELVTPATQQAIDRGLRSLADQQDPLDGSIGSGSNYKKNVAVTSLAGMAFLAAGHAPGRGEYGEVVDHALAFVLSRAKPNGYLVDDRYTSHGPMYGHGFATLFLAEAYGMSEREDLREKLDKAVQLIISSQNAEGGWRYEPGSPSADISVTVCEMMALRAARNAGIAVPRETVDRCLEYVTRSQNADGGFRYQLLNRAESRFPRSAAAVVALYNTGKFQGPEIERGLDYLMRYLPDGRLIRYEPHYMYGHYYACQAMWHAGGDRWQKWYPAIRDELVQRQDPNGAWPGDAICPEYGTAMACLILQTPNNYLPIFQR